VELSLHDGTALAIQVATGIALAASAGLRAFLPLFVVGVAGRMEWIPLTSSFEWLAGWPALTVFGCAVLVEIVGDKFPVIDHFLDSAQVLIKPVAGTMLAASVLTELSPLQAAVLALIIGGGVAEGVHLAKAKTRIVSTATTGGLGNPVLSVIEDVGAALGSIAAIVAPLLAVLVFLFVAGFLAWLFYRWLRAGSRARVVPLGPR